MGLLIQKLTTPEDIKRYNEFLNTINPNNPFYKPELLAFNLDKDYDLNYFVYFNNNIPVILMPFYLRSINLNGNETGFFDVISPYGYSGPLFDNDLDKSILVRFWSKIDSWYIEKNVITEFVRFSLIQNHNHYSGEVVHALRNVRGRILPEEKEQWDNFKPKVRNNYRKAIQNGLKFRLYHKDIKDSLISDFYDIYISTMQRNTATKSYYYDVEHFKKLVQNNPKNCALVMVSLNESNVSTELVLLSDRTIYSFLGGTKAEYFKTRPNDFLKTEVMNWGRKNGFQYYVLGGGRKDDDSLYAYKKTFFPKDDDVNYYTGRKILNSEVYSSLIKKSNEVLQVEAKKNDKHIDFFPLYRKEK